MPPASAALPSSTRPEAASRAIRRRPRTGRLLNCADGRPAGSPAGRPVSVPGLWLRHGQGGRAGQVRGPPPAAPPGPAHFVHGAPSPPAAASRQPGKPTGPVHFVHGALRLPSPGPAARPAAAGPSGAAPAPLMLSQPILAAGGMPFMFRPLRGPRARCRVCASAGDAPGRLGPAASSRLARSSRSSMAGTCRNAALLPLFRSPRTGRALVPRPTVRVHSGTGPRLRQGGPASAARRPGPRRLLRPPPSPPGEAGFCRAAPPPLQGPRRSSDAAGSRRRKCGSISGRHGKSLPALHGLALPEGGGGGRSACPHRRGVLAAPGRPGLGSGGAVRDALVLIRGRRLARRAGAMSGRDRDHVGRQRPAGRGAAPRPRRRRRGCRTVRPSGTTSRGKAGRPPFSPPVPRRRPRRPRAVGRARERLRGV